MSAKPQFYIKPTCRRGPPQHPTNPAYPEGVDVQEAAPGVASCRVELPYPAPERLVWQVRCRRCGYALAITAAGRADDPRSVTVPCHSKLQ
jgi:hypothetical protein